MRILLVNPATDFLTFKTHEILGLGYLASSLERAGHEVDIHDCNFEDPDPATIAARAEGAGMVGIATMIGKTGHALEVADVVGASSDAFLIMGGYTATYEYDAILRGHPHVDAVLRGEGEEVLTDLVGRIEAGTEWRDLKSLAFRDGEEVVANPMLALHMALDDLPFPRRSRYLDRIGLATILSARGCYAKCSFCNIQEFYNLSGYGGIRVRSAVNVVDEIEGLHVGRGIRKFLFIDDDMLGADFYAPGRNAAIADEIIRRGLDVEFEVAGRANDVVRFEETLVKLREAGLRRVYIGIESGSDTQLKRQRKGVSKQTNIDSLKVLERTGLGLDMGFIPFDPWCTPEEVVENFEFLRDHGVMEAANLNTAAVTMILYPGTALYQRALDEGLFVRADRFTYAYRFAAEEHEALFRRIIADIKDRSLLESVDRAIGTVKKDPEIRRLADDILDPAARRFFAAWTARVSAWCRGGEDPVADEQSAIADALLHGFCDANDRLSLLRAVPDGGAAAAAYAEIRDEILLWLRRVTADEGWDEVPERWRDRFAAEDAYIGLRHAAEGASDAPDARRYLNAAGTRVGIAATGKSGTVLADVVPPVPVPPGEKVHLGLHLFVPEDILAQRMLDHATSQEERFDTTLRAWVGDPTGPGTKLYRGWNEVESVVAADDPSATTLVLSSPCALEDDLVAGPAWFRTC